MSNPLIACCASADEQEEPCSGWAAGLLGSLPCSPAAAPHLPGLESPCPALGAPVGAAETQTFPAPRRRLLTPLGPPVC